MKITEKMRLKKALEMIERISANAQSVGPKRDWKESHESVCEIYQIVHTIRTPECRYTHPSWTKAIDDAIRAEQKP